MKRNAWIRSLSLTFALFLASAAGFLTGCASQEPGGAWAKADDVVTTVTDRLRADPLTARFSFAVSSEGGVVTLDGYVPDAGTRARALAIARGTPGVESVVDRLRY